MKSFCYKVVLVLGFVVLITTNAIAHKLFVSAWGEDGKIIGESSFSTGDVCKNSRVFVYDAEKKLIAQTKTNDQGEFSVVMPKGNFPWTVKVDGGDGHQALCELTKEDAGVTAKDTSNKTKTLVKEKTEAKTSETLVSAPGLTKEEMAELLSSKLNPIKAQLRTLVKKSEGVTLKDVVGGLGWIIGLMGLAGFFYSRRKN